MRSLFLVRTVLVVLLLALALPATMPRASSAQAGVAAPPAFSVARGFYDAPFQLILSAASGLTIRYTLDGSTPSASQGAIYSGPITIATSASVRAVAYSASQSASPAVTHTYIFPAAVRAQSAAPPPGWPAVFAVADLNGSYPADYEMDPEVTGHPNNSAKFDQVLKSLPSLSLVTDLPNLWHPTAGIYLNPNAKSNSPQDPFGTLWEREVSLEWINPDGTSGFAQIAGASIDGQTSRRPHRQPKKEFRLNFDSKYGVAGLDFDLFDASLPASSFSQLLLRNGGNRSWSYFDRDQRREADYINDEFARRAWLDMGNLAPHGTYAHLYINGLYWGLYNVTEHLSPEFLVSYYGATTADYEIVQANDDAGNYPQAVAGTVDAWNQVITQLSGAAPVDNTLYQTIAAQVDVANLADYIIHAHYLGKTDWVSQGWHAYRATAAGDTRFKFMPLDNDTGLNKVIENTTAITDTVGSQDSPDSVFRRLMSNAEFRQVLVDRFYKHIDAPNGALTTPLCSDRYDELATMIDQAVIAESARWGDYMRDVYPPTNVAPKGLPAYLHSRDLPLEYTDPAGAVVDADQKTWVEVRDEKLGAYCDDRDSTLESQYVANGWYAPALQAPTSSQAGGTIEAGENVTLSNPNGVGAIYYTTDGSDPRLQFGALSPTAVAGASVTINGNVTLKARVYNSGAGAWSPLLEQRFFIEQSFSSLVINEVHYGPIAPAGENPNDYEFIELYNRSGSTAINLEGVTFSSGVYYRFPAGATIPAGGYLALASNAASFQARYGFAPDGVFTGNLLNGGETLELSDPAGAPIDSVSYQSVSPWPTGANAGGGSLSLSSPGSNNALPTSWVASRLNGGTPRAANNATPAGKSQPTLTISAPASITYGVPLPIDATANVAGSFSYNPPLSTVLNAGADQPVQVIFTPNDGNAYVGVNEQVVIDVNRAPLTITALNKIKQVGTANPPLEASYSGFVNNDTAASLDVPPTLSTTADINSPIGDYPITVSGAFDPNYSITYVGGILTVTNKVVPTIAWSAPAPIVYGTKLSATQLNAVATSGAGGPEVAGVYSYNPPLGAALNAGPGQVLAVTFTPSDTESYVAVTKNVSIDVTKAPLTITAENKRKLVGAANPPLTASYQGFVNGDTAASLDVPPSLATTATASSPVGLYPITVSGAEDANYAISFVDGVLTVATTLEEEPPTYTINLPLLAR
jgi:hypothetical protein